jgi:hypothetical protein
MYPRGFRGAAVIGISALLAIIAISVQATDRTEPPRIAGPEFGANARSALRSDARDCEWVSYHCNDTYYWPCPDDYWGKAFAMRFSPVDCCTLTQVALHLYDDYPQFSNSSGEGINVQVWEDDGTGLPGTLLHSEIVPGANLVFAPETFTLELSGGGLVICENFHVGYSVVNEISDNIAVVSDDGTCGTLRSTGMYAGIWEPILDHFAIDVNFLISSKICIDWDQDSVCCLLEPSPGCEIPPAGGLNMTQEWAWTHSDLLHVYSDQVMMTPIVADLENDGNPEIFFISFRDSATWEESKGYPHFEMGGVLRVISGVNNGAEVFSWPPWTPVTQTDTANMLFGAGQLAVADLDGDDNGMLEIVGTRRGGPFGFDQRETAGEYLYCFDVLDHNSNGDYSDPGDVWIKWMSNQPSGGIRSSGISIADINRDGQPEVICGNVVLNGIDGSLYTAGGANWSETRPQADPDAGGFGVSTSFAADVVKGGDLEVVNGRTVYKSDGDTLWCLRDTTGGGFAGVANFDSDDDGEVVLVWEGNVSLIDYIRDDIDSNRTVRWTTTPSALIRGGPPCIAECNSSGGIYPEIGVAGDAFFYIIRGEDGTLLDGWMTQDGSSGITGSTMFDFEDDGITELIYNDEEYLRIYRSGAMSAVDWEVNSSSTVLENPVVADVDADARAEIVVCANAIYFGSHHGIRVFGNYDNKWVNTRRIWNQHAYSITNINDDGTVPEDRINNWENPDPLYNNFRKQMYWKEDPRYLPDLCVHQLRPTALPDCDGNGNARFTAAIANNGMAAVPPGVSVAFYETDDECNHLSLIGTASTSGWIEPGETEDVIFIDYDNCWGYIVWVEACVDDDGSGNSHIIECDENNNCCCKRLKFGCRSQLAGRKFEDLNLNGVYEGHSEPILPNWYIGLYKYHPSGNLELIDDTYTDLDGNYRFDCLKPLAGFWEYRIYEESPTMPPSVWLQTCPNQGYYQYDLGEAQSIASLNFGNIHRDDIQCDFQPNVAHQVFSFCRDTYTCRSSFTISSKDPWFPTGCNDFRWYLVSEPTGSPDAYCDRTGLVFSPCAGVLDFSSMGDPITVSFEANCSSVLPLPYEPGNMAGFKIVVRNGCNGDLYCLYGKAGVQNRWCAPLPSYDGPFDPNVGVVVHNTDETRTLFEYRFRALLTADGEPDPYVSLNSQPPGNSVLGSVEIPPGDSMRCSVMVAFTEPRPGEIHQILFEWDLDEDGYFDPALTMPAMYRMCGDADGNQVVNVSDIVYLINYVFGTGPAPNPMLGGDVDCNQVVNVSDIVYLINFVFGTGYDPCDTDGDGEPDC